MSDEIRTSICSGVAPETCGQKFDQKQIGQPDVPVWFPPLCPACQQIVTKRAADKEARRSRETMERALTEAGLPPIALHPRESWTTDQQAFLKAFRAMLENAAAPRWFLLTGGTGTGKSTLMGEAVRLFTQRGGSSSRYTVAGDLLLDVRRTYSDQRGPSEAEVIDGFRKPGVRSTQEGVASKMSRHFSPELGSRQVSEGNTRRAVSSRR